MKNEISSSTHCEYKYVVGRSVPWVDDWRRDWDSRDPDFSNRTSRLGSAQQFETFEEAEKSINRYSDDVYAVRIVTNTSMTIELDENRGSAAPTQSGGETT